MASHLHVNVLHPTVELDLSLYVKMKMKKVISVRTLMTQIKILTAYQWIKLMKKIVLRFMNILFKLRLAVFSSEIILKFCEIFSGSLNFLNGFIGLVTSFNKGTYIHNDYEKYM
jgi:hypothetical protein